MLEIPPLLFIDIAKSLFKIIDEEKEVYMWHVLCVCVRACMCVIIICLSACFCVYICAHSIPS